jgi:hypothetical protein
MTEQTKTKEPEPIHGWLCGPRIYEYKGVEFEVHSYCGPCPLRKDGSPKVRIPKTFWPLYEEFDKLSKEEKKKYHLGGGCQRF